MQVHHTRSSWLQPERVPLAKHELHRLLENHDLAGMPLLVLANKVDIAKIGRDDLVKSTSDLIFLDNGSPVCVFDRGLGKYDPSRVLRTFSPTHLLVCCLPSRRSQSRLHHRQPMDSAIHQRQTR